MQPRRVISCLKTLGTERVHPTHRDHLLAFAAAGIGQQGRPLSPDMLRAPKMELLLKTILRLARHGVFSHLTIPKTPKPQLI